MSIYTRLEYDYDGTGVFNFSSNVISMMSNVPPLLEHWQTEDISNDNVHGYFRNPVANSIINIRSECNQIHSTLTSSSFVNEQGNTVTTQTVSGSSIEITSMFASMNVATANIAGTNGSLFYEHTNRISGVTTVAESASQNKSHLPHFSTAIGTGQLMTYLLYQTDNVTNSSAITGNFTSMMIKVELEELETSINSYNTEIENSITTSQSTDSEGNVTITRVSNLPFETVNSMFTIISTINDTLAQRRTHDENFFANSRKISEEYGILNMLNPKTMGATSRYLLENFNGSDKLLTRIKS